MFCAQCGKRRLDETARYCVSCGSQMEASVSAQTGMTPPNAPTVPFGEVKFRIQAPFRLKRQLSNEYSWLSGSAGCVACDDHIIAYAGGKTSKADQVLDLLEHSGVMFGAVGTVVTGLAFGVPRMLMNKAATKKTAVSLQNAIELFSRRALVWCEKKDVEIWRYNEKRWLGAKTSSEQIYCPFKSADGVIHACATLWCTAQSGTRDKPDILSAFGGKLIEVAQDMRLQDVPSAMAEAVNRLPD